MSTVTLASRLYQLRQVATSHLIPGSPSEEYFKCRVRNERERGMGMGSES